MIKLYDLDLSGNCHKVRLMLSLLSKEFESIPVDLFGGEAQTPAFLKLNLLGEVPVLVDGNVILRDSQAILVYLAKRYGNEDWLPTEAETMSHVMEWLFFAANYIRQGPEFARRYYKFNLKIDIELATERAYSVLKILDDRLSQKFWLTSAHATIADIACFPYIGLAPEGKIALDSYQNVISWLERIKQLPGYLSMPGL
ncbi:Glutathione S-transferase domain protein (plasmid) [Stanieria sp. NIES-3757]|nr:Glutathione S-transferase domain protein [Stanieria sp. NIES-3757]